MACEMCSEEHTRLLEVHAAEMHALDKDIEQALFGPVDARLGYQVRDHVKGMQYQLEQLYSHTENGGMPSKLNRNDRRLVISIFTVTFTALIADLFAHL